MVQVAPNRYPHDNWNPGAPGKAKRFEWERIGQYEFLRRGRRVCPNLLRSDSAAKMGLTHSEKARAPPRPRGASGAERR